MSSELPFAAEAAVAFLLVAGASFALIGSIGLVRFRDFYTRLHGPTKATTLGVGSMLAASALFFSVRGGALSLHEILIAAFLFMTAPVSAHLMSKAALHTRVRHVSAGMEGEGRRQATGDRQQGDEGRRS